MANFNIQSKFNLEENSTYADNLFTNFSLVQKGYSANVDIQANYANSTNSNSLNLVSRAYSITKVIASFQNIPQRPTVGQVFPN